MNRLISASSLLAAAVTFGALAAVPAAHARPDVSVSIGLGVPYGYAYPAPVYVQPAPVYVQPRPVYVQPQTIYLQPQPIYHEHRHPRRHGPWGDADRDGVPNRYDRAPHNPYYR